MTDELKEDVSLVGTMWESTNTYTIWGAGV